MQSNRERFNFFVPVEIEKAGKNGEEMRIKGIASTADKDVQGETLLPSGFDLNRFLNQGFLNWNHTAKSDPSSIVGEPVKAEITKDNKLYIEGVLYNDHPVAQKVWDLAKTLEKSGSKRRLGFSIEGVATERDYLNPKIVKKAEITGCAITPTPVNKNTVMEIMKGETETLFHNYTYQDWQESAGGTSDIILKGIDVESGLVYEVTRRFDIVSKSIDSVAAAPLTLEDLEGVKRSIRTLSKAMEEGLLSEGQVREFKKALDAIKTMG